MFGQRRTLVNVLRLSGLIRGSNLFERALSVSSLAPRIDAAFKGRRLGAVALAINSPGGSPVQASLIARRIRDLARQKDIPVLAFCEDVAASGGYWLACAADEIFADANSMIGSIGVITASFGLPGLLDKAGIERRVYTAGARKNMLDPFLAENPNDVARLKKLHEELHGRFKDYVRSRRGVRLRAEEEELFSGDFWTGHRAQEMGLIDGLGEMRAVLKERFGETLRIREIGPRRLWFRRRFGISSSLAPPEYGADLGRGLLSAIEERLWWNRFGL